MTDPFEEAVRDALRGTTAAAGEMPTYHGAWQRGRRRRLIKRSALAAAGAVVLVAALTVNLGRLPGGEPTESSDVATGSEGATAVFEPTTVATTAPLQTPLAASPQADVTDSASTEATTSSPGTAESPAPTALPTAAAATAPATVVPQTVVPQTVVPPTVVPPTVVPQTVVPTVVAQTVVPATPVPAAQDESSTPNPAALAVPTVDPATDQDPGSAAGTAQQPADPGSPDAPLVGPEPAFTTAAPADAVLLGGAARGVAVPCDLDQDGVADATCELLADYLCTGDGDVRPGYSAVDTDGNQISDTCMAFDLTVCDTNSDGRGDTPCIIDVSVVPQG